jgi:hypothetical protein
LNSIGFRDAEFLIFPGHGQGSGSLLSCHGCISQQPAARRQAIFPLNFR